MGIRVEDAQFQDCVMTAMFDWVKMFRRSQDFQGRFASIAASVVKICAAESQPRRMLVDWIMYEDLDTNQDTDTETALISIRDDGFFRELAVELLKKRWESAHRHGSANRADIICTSISSGRTASFWRYD